MEASNSHPLESELSKLFDNDPSLLGALLRSSFDGVTYRDLQSPEREWISPSFWDTLGFDPETKQHLSWERDELVHPGDRKALQEALQKHYADPTVHLDQVVRYRRFDRSTAWMRCRGLAIRTETGVPTRMLITFQNLTEYKQKQARTRAHATKLATHVASLERNVQDVTKANERWKTFSYAVSHDLKAPLRGIITCLGWLEEELGENLTDDARENVAFIKSRTARMRALIDGALAYARVGHDESLVEDVDTKSLVNELATEIPAESKAVVTVSDSLPRVMYSRSELARVFQNLISNAVRFNPSPEKRIWVGVEKFDEAYRFTVTDDGPGIAPANHQQVFGMYTTLQSRDEYESTGVGLAICKAIVERNGGSIGVESDGKSGSTFWFTVLIV